MGCGPGAPIPYQLSLAHFASANLAQRTLDPQQARLHLQLALNCLVGRSHADFQPQEAHFSPHHGDPGDLVNGIGEGIIPDLDSLKNNKHHARNEKWDENMEFALKIAQLAQTVAAKGVENGKTIEEIHRSARMVSCLMQSALEGCLP